MLLDKVGVLEPEDLAEVLSLSRKHSEAGVAAIISEKKGLITDQDVHLFLYHSKINYFNTVKALIHRNRSTEALELAKLIDQVFPKCTKDALFDSSPQVNHRAYA